MSTVIGLRSGKEFIVKEGYFPFVHKVTGAVTHIFVTPDEKRMITIPPTDSPVEFYDEPVDPKFLEALNTGVQYMPEEKAANDPNIR